MLHDWQPTPGRRLSIRTRQIEDDPQFGHTAPIVRLPSIVSALWRYGWWIGAWTLLVPLLAIAAMLLMPRQFESSTRLMVDPRGLSVVENDVTPSTSSPDQLGSVVESEMQFLTSDIVYRRVIENLDLAADPEFNGTKRYAWSPLVDVVDGIKSVIASAFGAPPSEPAPELTALGTLRDMVGVYRQPNSFVLDMSVTTQNADKSAKIANAISQQYVETRFSTRSQVTQRANDTITGRLAELRQAVETADDKVEQYKRENGIIGASGTLVNEQQLTELNSQLSTARSQVSQAQARVDQINTLLRSGAEPDAIAEAISSQAIASLRSQYARAQRRVSSLQSNLLPAHPVLRQAREELAATRRLISAELTRIAKSAELDLTRAKNNERDLAKRLEELKTLAQTTNQKQVKLRELERSAEAARAVYTSLLARSKELGEQGRVDPSIAVVLSPAVPPQNAEGPGRGAVGLIGAFVGLLFGIATALLRDFRDPNVRTIEHLSDAMNAQATLIPIPAKRSGRKRRGEAAAGPPADPLIEFTDTGATADAARAVRKLASEILSVRDGAVSSLVLVTSASKQAPKSTVAMNLALAMADLGGRILLVDADCEARKLSREIGAERRWGLENALEAGAVSAKSIMTITEFNIDLMPNGQRALNARNRKVEQTIRSLADGYDVVVVEGGVLPRGRLLPSFVGLSRDVVYVALSDDTEKSQASDAASLLRASGVERLRPVLTQS